METRRSSKKTRSYGAPPRNSRSIPSSVDSSNGSRPQHKERVKSAPLGVPQIEEQQQHGRFQQIPTGTRKKGSQTEDSDAGSSPPSPTSTRNQHVSDMQRRSSFSQVLFSSETTLRYRHADCSIKSGGSGEIQEVVLVVIGAPAAGKSTFVHCALDLKRASTSPISSKKVSLEGRISIVRLLEIGIEDVEITEDENLCWPRKVGDQIMPGIDGVLALYDVMDQASITPLPKLLSECL